MTATTVVAVKTVVVADDTDFVRERFRAALHGVGHRVLVVRTGAELLAKVRQTEPRIDLILLDLHIPQGHGVQLLRSLQSAGRILPPIVVFSGTIQNADEVRELSSLGVAGYVNEYTAVQHILPSLAAHLFPDHRNRRTSPRAAIGLPVSYRFGNTIASALTLNISRGGLAIRTTSPLEPGATLRVRFRLPNGKKDIEATARVCWTDRRLGMGIQFTTIDVADQTDISNFVESHFFSNRKA